RHGRVVVSVVAHDLPRLAGRLLQRGLEGHRVVARVGAVVPDDLERVPALDRRPRVAGDHGNAAQGIELDRGWRRIDLHHTVHTGNLQGLGSVEAPNLAAQHRRTGDHCVEHAGQSCVDAVLRLASGDVLGIDQLQLALADVTELRRILEL